VRRLSEYALLNQWKRARARGARFVAAVLAHGLSHVVQDSFRGLSSRAKLSEVANAVLVRADPDADGSVEFIVPGSAVRWV
jgi:hypothetical protein